jgi:hypothetical protein
VIDAPVRPLYIGVGPAVGKLGGPQSCVDDFRAENFLPYQESHHDSHVLPCSLVTI